MISTDSVTAQPFVPVNHKVVIHGLLTVIGVCATPSAVHSISTLVFVHVSVPVFVTAITGRLASAVTVLEITAVQPFAVLVPVTVYVQAVVTSIELLVSAVLHS